MKIAIASDHGGYKLKEALKQHLLKKEDIEVIDLGTDSEESVDYPVFGHRCGECVASGQADRGIVCCGTGIGISISANKVPGIRCALLSDEYSAEYTKRHNDANIIAFGGRVVSSEKACALTDIWLGAEFEGGRHKKRIDMIEDLSKK